MKKMSLTKYILVFVIGFIGINCTQPTGASNNGSTNTVTFRLNKDNPKAIVPLKLEVQETDKEPAIFYYLANSDYIAEVSLDKKNSVGKVESGKKLDLSKRVAGIIYSFKVEKILCSKETFLAEAFTQRNSTTDFEVFVPIGTLDENYKKDRRYLIFLREIPADEKLSEIYELDVVKKYFRPFRGERSIFPNQGGEFHSPPTKGIIDMSNTKHKSLVKRIEVFCTAVSATEKSQRLKNLQNLSKSEDEELKENAIYALKFFQTRQFR